MNPSGQTLELLALLVCMGSAALLFTCSYGRKSFVLVGAMNVVTAVYFGLNTPLRALSEPDLAAPLVSLQLGVAVLAYGARLGSVWAWAHPAQRRPGMVVLSVLLVFGGIAAAFIAGAVAVGPVTVGSDGTWHPVFELGQPGTILLTGALGVTGLGILSLFADRLRRMEPNELVRALPFAIVVVSGLVMGFVAETIFVILGGGFSKLVALVAIFSTIFEFLTLERASRLRLIPSLAAFDMTQAIREALFLVAPDGRIDFANPQAVSVLGRDPTGIALAAVLHEDPQSGDSRLKTSGGDYLPVVVSRAPIVLPGGGARGEVISATDVSHIQRAVESLRDARDAAENAARSKAEFLAVMSHEIRTPMNAVVGLAHLMESSSLDTVQREWARTIRQSSDALLSIINDILDLSRLESGRFQVEQVRFALRETIEGTADVVRGEARKQRLQLSVQIDPEVPRFAIGDPTRVRQVLLNLLSNAIKFTDSGEVSLRAQWMEETLSIDVVDTGPGISEEVRERLFEPFEQFDASTTRRHGGTGLGLTISRRLAHLMGGEITLRSTVGVGSTFTIRVPAPAASDPIRELCAHHEPTGAIVRRVLVVEDNAVNRKVARALLERFGATVTEAVDGIDGVACCLSGRFDLVLMDLQMPRMDGYEAMRAIVRHMGDDRPMLVAFSANVMAEERQAASDAGADAHLAKPVTPAALKDCLRAAHVRQANERARRAG